jgi:hypothetical protein
MIVTYEWTWVELMKKVMKNRFISPSPLGLFKNPLATTGVTPRHLPSLPTPSIDQSR